MDENLKAMPFLAAPRRVASFSADAMRFMLEAFAPQASASLGGEATGAGVPQLVQTLLQASASMSPPGAIFGGEAPNSGRDPSVNAVTYGPSSYATLDLNEGEMVPAIVKMAAQYGNRIGAMDLGFEAAAPPKKKLVWMDV